MIPITERKFLQQLRETAQGMVCGNMNPDWVRAYESLGDAADRLDAMQARSEDRSREPGRALTDDDFMKVPPPNPKQR